MCTSTIKARQGMKLPKSIRETENIPGRIVYQGEGKYHAPINGPPFLHWFVTTCPLFQNFTPIDLLFYKCSLSFRSKFSTKSSNF